MAAKTGTVKDKQTPAGLTFSQKEIRSEKKKERTANRRFTETKNDDYLRKADKHRERWMELERNQKVDQEKKKIDTVNENKTEDQLFNEARRFNRKMRNEAEKKKKLQMEKEANLKELRMKAKILMEEKKTQEKNKAENEKKLEEKFNKETNDQKIAFAKKMREEKAKYFAEMKENDENDNHFDEQAYIQKAFRRYQFDRMKYGKMEANMKALFTMMGMEEQEVEKKFKDYINHLTKAQESGSNINLDFELSDYLEGFDQTMIEDKITELEDPIPEEEVEIHASL